MSATASVTVAQITFGDNASVASLSPDQLDLLSLGLEHTFGIQIPESRPACGGIWLHHVESGAMLLRKASHTVAEVWTAAGHMESWPMPALRK